MNDAQQILRDHFEDPYHRGECEALTHAATLTCPESQCQLAVELCLDRNGKVLQAWFDGQGCSFCEAVASILMSYSEGKTCSELQQLSPAGYLKEIGISESTPESLPVCQLLPLQTLQHALTRSVANQDSELGDWAVDETGFGGPSLREEC